MINVGFKSYDGGKSGDGVYQTLINLIPPHLVYYSLCLGNCGPTRHKLPALHNYLNDLDLTVLDKWKTALAGDERFFLICKDAVELLCSIANKCDTADTFIFIDAPYLMETRKDKRKIYKHEPDEVWHVGLLQACRMIKNAKLMVTHYPCDMYDEGLKGWHTVDYESRTRQGMATERVYMNYCPGDKLHDYRYIGGDFREREAYARIKKNWFLKLERLPAVVRNALLADIASQIK